MTASELLVSLAAYTEHRDLCPWLHGRTFDEQGRERPCRCGLNALVAEAHEVAAALEAQNTLDDPRRT